MERRIYTLSLCLFFILFLTPSVEGQNRGRYLNYRDAKVGKLSPHFLSRNGENESDSPNVNNQKVLTKNDFLIKTKPVENASFTQANFSSFNFDARWKSLGPVGVIARQNNPDFSYTGIQRNGFYGLTLAPYDPNVMWAATLSSGIWKTWDAGKTWIPISTENLKGAEISAMAVDPYNPNIIYANSGYSSGEVLGLFKTTDGGANWGQLRSLTYDDRALSILIHPKQNNKILTGSNTDIQYSENGGATWSRAYGDFYSYNMKLAQSTTQPDIIYAAIQDEKGFKIIKSNDFGKTWGDTGMKDMPLNVTNMDIAVTPKDANTIYMVYCAATSAGEEFSFQKSTDGGQTWTTQSGGHLNKFGFELKLTVDLDDANKLYFATDSLIGFADITPKIFGVYQSTDGGKTFKIIGSHTKALNGQNNLGIWMTSLQQHPITKELFCSYFFGGLYKVKTEGLTSGDLDNFSCTFGPLQFDKYSYWKGDCPLYNNNWVRLSDPINGEGIGSVSIKGNDVIVTAVSGNYKWDGTKWLHISPYESSNAVQLNTPNSHIEWAFSSLRKTTDGGVTFKTISTPEMDNEIFTYHADNYMNANNYNILYLLKNNIWKTTDGGNVWSKIEVPADPTIFQLSSAFAISPVNENIIYLGRNGGGISFVYKSIDGGKTWQNIKTGNIPNLFIDRMIVHPTNPNRAWILFQRTRLFETNDGGLTWTDIGAGLPPYPVRSRAMAFDEKRNTLYVGNEFGVYIKTPNDSQFRLYNVVIPNILIGTLAIDDKNNKIYAGTSAGLWVGDLYGETTSNTVAFSKMKTNNNTFKAFPNPAKEKINLDISNLIECTWTIRLTNSLGQTIFTKTGNGSQKMEILTSNLKSGWYFIDYQTTEEHKVEKILVQH